MTPVSNVSNLLRFALSLPAQPHTCDHMSRNSAIVDCAQLTPILPAHGPLLGRPFGPRTLGETWEGGSAIASPQRYARTGHPPTVRAEGFFGDRGRGVDCRSPGGSWRLFWVTLCEKSRGCSGVLQPLAGGSGGSWSGGSKRVK